MKTLLQLITKFTLAILVGFAKKNDIASPYYLYLIEQLPDHGRLRPGTAGQPRQVAPVVLHGDAHQDVHEHGLCADTDDGR